MNSITKTFRQEYADLIQKFEILFEERFLFDSINKRKVMKFLLQIK